MIHSCVHLNLVMPFLMDAILRNYFKYRQMQVEDMAKNAVSKQKAILKKVIASNAHTEYGEKTGLAKARNSSEYKKHIPLVTYEDLFPFINRMIRGEENVLTHDRVKWFAKSSGTTNARSKYIPTSDHYLRNGHMKCTWTAASVIYNEDNKAKLFQNKTLIMGGSLEDLPAGAKAGDVSAIMLHHFPKIGRRFYTPDFETAIQRDWDKKINAIAEICSKEKVTLIGGVPSWLLVLLERILEHTGKDNISEVWPTLRSVIHGGVSFLPYQKKYKKLIPSEAVAFREVYNASEGYFAIQDLRDVDGMLLLCDHEIYYEFIPVVQTDLPSPETLTIEEVELHQAYEIVITNSSGLYRYRMGDIIEFVSIRPFRIKHLGRTQQHLNLFGEELMLHNTDKAITETCEKFNLQLVDYCVAPYLEENGSLGRHLWAIEFESSLMDINSFSAYLDTTLKKINSDYAAKRSQGLVLGMPEIIPLQQGTIEKWQRQQGKYGGQYKLPRLNNDVKLVEELKSISSMLAHGNSQAPLELNYN